MIEWRFTPDDVARVRFAFSPLTELVMSLIVLRAPAAHSLHLPWVRATRPLVAGLDLSELFALVPVRGPTADFLAPPPVSPLPDFGDELELLRATPPDRVAAELAEVPGLPSLPPSGSAPIPMPRSAASRAPCGRTGTSRSPRIGRGSRRCWRRTCCGGPGNWPRAGRRPCLGTCTRPSPGTAAG